MDGIHGFVKFVFNGHG